MVYGREPHPRLPSFGGIGGGAPPPRDLIVLLVVVFVTFAFQFFPATSLVVAVLRLTTLVWRAGFVWQLVTYPFVGFGPPSFWFLLELLILFWFGRDVYYRLGRRGFWTTLLVGAGAAGVVAVLVQVAGWLVTGSAGLDDFVILQGQRVLLAMMIAAFATLMGDATIYLFFVLPVRARWFLWIEILFAFMAYLGTKDLPGFLGLCTAVGAVWFWLQGSRGRRLLREWWLRLQRRWIQWRLRGRRRKSGFEVIPGDKDDRGPYVN